MRAPLFKTVVVGHWSQVKCMIIWLLIFCFLLSSYPLSLTTYANELKLPEPGVMVHLSPEFTPAHLQGITIHPDNALQFDFLIHKGDKDFQGDQKKEEYKKLVKYFLASLTIPDEDQWVNLSPYEKDRIIKDDFGKTEMGRDLLAQDYLLKQITASLIYPEDTLGKKFWDKIYERAWKEYHTSNIPVNTFNKVWIVPDQAIVYESGNTAYILKSHLKVMLEEDYLSMSKHGDFGVAEAGAPHRPDDRRTMGKAEGQDPKIHSMGSQLIRELILPELEKEVNEGENFASLRQMYSGMVLATWYKKALKESLLSKVYADKAKVKGVSWNMGNVYGQMSHDPILTPEEIYKNYLQAFKKGCFNYIKKDVDKYTKESIPRKYFSGGFFHRAGTQTIVHSLDEAMPVGVNQFDMATLASAVIDIATANIVLPKQIIKSNMLKVYPESKPKGAQVLSYDIELFPNQVNQQAWAIIKRNITDNRYMKLILQKDKFSNDVLLIKFGIEGLKIETTNNILIQDDLNHTFNEKSPEGQSLKRSFGDLIQEIRDDLNNNISAQSSDVQILLKQVITVLDERLKKGASVNKHQPGEQLLLFPSEGDHAQISNNTTGSREIIGSRITDQVETTPDNTITVFQNHYVVVSKNDSIQFLQTYGLGPCIGLLIWDEKNQVAGMAHLDALTNKKDLLSFMWLLVGKGASWENLKAVLVGGNSETDDNLIKMIRETLIMGDAKHTNIILDELKINKDNSSSQSIVLDLFNWKLARLKQGTRVLSPDPHQVLFILSSRVLSNNSKEMVGIIQRIPISDQQSFNRNQGRFDTYIVSFNSPRLFDDQAMKSEDVLRNAGFEDLKNGYFLMKNKYFIKLDDEGNINKFFLPFNPYHSLDEIVSLDIDRQEFPSPAIKIIYRDDSYYLFTLGGGFSSGKIKSSSGNFTLEERQSVTPLKERLLKLGAKETISDSGIFEFDLGNEGEVVVLYKDEKILFIGKTVGITDELVRSKPNIIKYDEKSGLVFQEGPLQYTVAFGHKKLLLFDKTKELKISLTDRQQHQEAPNKDGFVIGGVNTNETIAGLKEISGLSIPEIERRARPEYYSRSGFISANDKFLDILAADNTFIRRQGMTHQQIAEPLFYVVNLLGKVGSWGESVEFRYKGVQYKAGYTQWRGSQQSIFNDHLIASRDYWVTNINRGITIKFSEILPDYIWRYGFYEGHTAYRVEPSKVIEVFNIVGTSELTQTPGDQAMKGGIDFNAANLNLQIKRDGRGVPLPLAQQDMSQLSAIEGFEPNIIEIKAAINLPVIAEIRQALAQHV